MDTLMRKTYEFIENRLKAKQVPALDIKELTEHLLRVANTGYMLARKEKANIRVVVLGCLLHNIGKFETPNPYEHRKTSAMIARNYLCTLALTKSEIDEICTSIELNRSSVLGQAEPERPLETKIVMDADNIDRFRLTRIIERIIKIDAENETIEAKILDAQSDLERVNHLLETQMMETVSGNEWYRNEVEAEKKLLIRYLNQLKLTRLPDGKIED